MNLSITNLNVRRSAAVAARQTLAMVMIALSVLAALERSAQAAPPSIVRVLYATLLKRKLRFRVSPYPFFFSNSCMN